MKRPAWAAPWIDRLLGPKRPAPSLSATVVPTHVFRWDLDKTYLRTEFDSLGDLLKSAFETAADKQAYPGATAVLRALHRPDHRICIVSGSPSQMKQVLAAKLALDGVSYDEFVLKNNLRNIVAGRFRAIRSQIPYKLPAMLQSRLASPPAPRETLFGDDAEADAIIYCLYADIVAGVVTQDTLAKVLEAARAYPDDVPYILDLAARVPKAPAVQRMFINLDRKSPPVGFYRFGTRVVPVYNYFQTALVLWADQVLSERQVLFVAQDMLATKQFTAATLANSLQDLVRRGHLTPDAAEALTASWQHVSETPRAGVPSTVQLAEVLRERASIIQRLAPPAPRSTATADAQPTTDAEAPLDYVRIVDEEHLHRRDRRKHGFGA